MEWPVRILLVISTILLWASYISAWFQHELTAHFDWTSAFVFHLASAGSSVLLSFFANLSILFYFIGTGLWMKDQAKSIVKDNKTEAVKIWEIYENSNKLKGRAFPFATFAIFFGILTFVMGGALQVGAIPYWAHPALATVLLITQTAGIPFVYKAINLNFNNLNKCSDLLDEVKTLT
ncbi:hypothetical protein GW915_04320 [bacterium]|nr:hypothetical protein [bacterium]